MRQRVLQIACGYEDQDDADFLRRDPLFKLACGRLPQTGEDLASQPTLSRLENAPDSRACYRMARALLELYVSQRSRRGAAPERVLLDFDSTEDPAHGEQEEGVAYHGYFGQSTSTTRWWSSTPTRARSSPRSCARATPTPGTGPFRCSSASWGGSGRNGPTHGSRDPGRRRRLRAVPAVYEWCEQQGIFYTIGLVPNPRLEDLLAAPLAFLATKLASMVRMR